jgi:hypothetical protein
MARRKPNIEKVSIAPPPAFVQSDKPPKKRPGKVKPCVALEKAKRVDHDVIVDILKRGNPTAENPLEKFPPPNGGPLVPTITDEQVYELSLLGCTIVEIAAIFGVDEKTIDRRFSAVHARGKAMLSAQLRSWQLDLAKDQHPTMLIWLAKNYCGMTDSPLVVHSETTRVLPPDELRAKLSALVVNRLQVYTNKNEGSNE